MINTESSLIESFMSESYLVVGAKILHAIANYAHDVDSKR